MRSRSALALVTAAALSACSSSGGSSGPGASGGSGGSSASGGSGGTSASGGSTGTGGLGSGGAAGSRATGGSSASGGTGGSGGGAGSSPSGSGGTAGSSSGKGGASGGGGSSTGGAGGGLAHLGPCDIYAAANTPCVAANSTVRALYAAYSGKLYQVRRASDMTTHDIPTASPGGLADSAQQDTFCTGTTCTVSVVYDQSPMANHMPVSGPVHWLPNGGKEANATGARITIGGHTVYGILFPSDSTDSYRIAAPKGVAIGDMPEAIYMVADGKRYNGRCCFDYGNVESTGNADGPATMEAINFSNIPNWSVGAGNGPWVMTDLEFGVWAGGSATVPSNTPLVAKYVTLMLKGPSGKHMTLKGGDAQSGALAVKYDGARPAGYDPMKKQGALELGVGGDGSGGGTGVFFEGAVTAGNPPDSADDAVQANIVAAGYGQ